ncbi:Putative GrpE nucleotide exchange factor [Septoria linicola]|uniref:GrpE protein homolog n=1 Tax=Septoria linicola TaxID=215465 RepID=A0A9Q9AGE5_9PEZI|nr:Putative GrpE nucleotide exchange factor [Septoria linicola]
MLQQRITRSLQTLSRQPQTLRAARTTSTSPFSAYRPASQNLAARRWYSSAKEESDKKQEDILKNEGKGTQDTAKEGAAKEAENPLQKEVEALKKESLEATDKLKRQIAEYRNLQEQTKREVKAAKDFALQRFAKDLLDSVDNLDRALQNVPKEKLTDANPDLVNLHSGLKMTDEILVNTLKKHGMERIDPSAEGEAFNPNLHEATFQAPQPDKKDGTVFFTQQKGFLYNGRVLRAAKVGVVRNS